VPSCCPLCALTLHCSSGPLPCAGVDAGDGGLNASPPPAFLRVHTQEVPPASSVDLDGDPNQSQLHTVVLGGPGGASARVTPNDSWVKEGAAAPGAGVGVGPDPEAPPIPPAAPVDDPLKNAPAVVEPTATPATTTVTTVDVVHFDADGNVGFFRSGALEGGESIPELEWAGDGDMLSTCACVCDWDWGWGGGCGCVCE
jgi:hypothetical protein